jgi:hypothetical protein
VVSSGAENGCVAHTTMSQGGVSLSLAVLLHLLTKSKTTIAILVMHLQLPRRDMPTNAENNWTILTLFGGLDAQSQLSSWVSTDPFANLRGPTRAPPSHSVSMATKGSLAA